MSGMRANRCKNNACVYRGRVRAVTSSHGYSEDSWMIVTRPSTSTIMSECSWLPPAWADAARIRCSGGTVEPGQVVAEIDLNVGGADRGGDASTRLLSPGEGSDVLRDAGEIDPSGGGSGGRRRSGSLGYRCRRDALPNTRTSTPRQWSSGAGRSAMGHRPARGGIPLPVRAVADVVSQLIWRTLGPGQGPGRCWPGSALDDQRPASFVEIAQRDGITPWAVRHRVLRVAEAGRRLTPHRHFARR